MRGPHGHSNAKYNAPDRRTARRLAAADLLRQCRASRFCGANAKKRLQPGGSWSRTWDVPLREKSGTILICAMGRRFPLYYGVGNSLSWYVAAILPDYPHSSARSPCPCDSITQKKWASARGYTLRPLEAVSGWEN